MQVIPAGDPPLTGGPFVLLNGALLLGNVLVLFNTGALSSITLHVTGDLGVSPSHAAWLQTHYFISLALAMPVTSWLSARFGEVRLFLSAMLLLTMGSALCAFATDISGFLLGRVLQGFFGGITIPLSQTLLLRQYPESKKPFAIALWSMATLSPFTLGPVAGGWIADALGWRWLFYLNVPLTLISASIAWALLSERTAPRPTRPFDGVGFALLAVTLGCLQTVLNRGQDEDWYNSPLIILMAVAGLLGLVYFVVWELAERHPLIDLRLLLRRNFAIGTLGLSLSFLLMYGLLSVLLVRLQTVAGYTSFLAGAILVPLAFLAKPMASVLHRIVHRFDARWLASVNLLAFAGFSYWTSRYDFFGRASLFGEVLGSQVLEGFCLGGMFVPLTTLFLSGLTPRRQVQAAELGGMLRVLGGSAASPLLGVLWDRRAAFHQSRLTETLSVYEPLGREAFASFNAAGLPDSVALAKLGQLASHHAAILALNDAFRVAAWLFLGLAAIVWLARPVGPTRPPTPKEEFREAALQDLVEEP